MPFASALSQHPDPRQAVAEVSAEVINEIGEFADLLIVNLTPAHLEFLDEIARAIDTLTKPGVLVGVVASGIIGINQEVEFGPGICVFAAKLGRVAAIELNLVELISQATDASTTAESIWDKYAENWVSALGDEPDLLLIYSSKHRFPTQRFLTWFSDRFPSTKVAGGDSSYNTDAGASLLIGSTQLTAGLVGILLSSEVAIRTILSHGAKPVGLPLVVTAADGPVIKELSGKRAMDRFLEVAHEYFSPYEVRLANQGALQIGTLVDPNKETIAPNDFVITPVLGAVPSLGGIAIDGIPEVGSTIQFHIRDPKYASTNLERSLENTKATASLIFSDEKRGSSFFGKPHHDARLILKYFGYHPVGGCFVSGAIGTLENNKPYLNSSCSSLVLFEERK